jgi:hypothetical protein
MLAKPDLPKHLKICRMGRSLYLTLPAEYVRAHNLVTDDAVFWQPEPDGIKLKFPTTPPHDAEAR